MWLNLNRNDNPEGEQQQDDEPDKDGLWEETFKGHTDSKPRGPSSIGLDVAFIESKHVYGVPEHADSLKLKDTQYAIEIQHTELIIIIVILF